MFLIRKAIFNQHVAFTSTMDADENNKMSSKHISITIKEVYPFAPLFYLLITLLSFFCVPLVALISKFLANAPAPLPLSHTFLSLHVRLARTVLMCSDQLLILFRKENEATKLHLRSLI